MHYSYRPLSVAVLASLAVTVVQTLPAVAQTIGTNITSVTTRTVSFGPSVVPFVRGDSEFEGGVFALNFAGKVQTVTGFAFAGGTAIPGPSPAQVFVRRKPTSDRRQGAYYQGTFDAATGTFNFESLGPLTEGELFNVNNLLAGPDNVFTNTGANVGGVTYNGNFAIERVDVVLPLPVLAGSATGFAVFERGAPAGHDGFGIAAITGVNPLGNPTSFGPVYIVPAGSWGLTPLVEPIPRYYFVNNAARSNVGVPSNPALTIPAGQTFGGLLIRTSELVPEGQQVYGYALFGPDVTCTAQQLPDLTDACYPTNTGTNGGIDLGAVNLGVVFLEAQ